MNQDILEKLSVTRARVEAVATGPSVICVTSACRGDGSELLAYGLARSLAAVGSSVLLVRPGDSVRPLSLSKSAGNGNRGTRAGRDGEPATMDLSGSYSLEAAQAAFEDYRRQFSFTVVDASLAQTDGSSLSLASAADAVLIAVELGRSSRQEDRELAQSLRAAGAKTLGVVTIDRKAIRDFNRTGPASEPLLPPSRVEVDELVGRKQRYAAPLG